MRHIYSFFKQNILAGMPATVPFGLTLLILFKLGKRITGLVSAAPAKLIGSPPAELPKGLFEVVTFLIGLLGTLLVPTTPNPTAGYYIMLPEEEITELPISIEDAFKVTSPRASHEQRRICCRN